jgi:oligopeptide transport system permease protein
MYFLKRAAFIPPLMLLISLLAFCLVRLAPGGPFDKERTIATPEIERNLKAKYHLDEPLLQQYFRYLTDLLHGDLGPSLKYRNHTINDVIRDALPVSLLLGLLSFLFANAIGIPIGIWTAVRRGQWQEHLGNAASILAVCVPALVLGPLLVMAFSVRLQWFPVGLWRSPMHAVLPTITLGLFFAGRIARLAREGMLGVLQAEFVTAARARGVSEALILLKHCLRPALLPVISYSGPLLADLLTGSFVVENVFQIPGIGVFMVNSSLNRDYTMVVGLVLVYAALLLVLNLAVDFAYTLLDPRVKYEASGDRA